MHKLSPTSDWQVTVSKHGPINYKIAKNELTFFILLTNQRHPIKNKKKFNGPGDRRPYSAALAHVPIMHSATGQKKKGEGGS